MSELILFMHLFIIYHPCKKVTTKTGASSIATSILLASNNICKGMKCLLYPSDPFKRYIFLAQSELFADGFFFWMASHVFSVCVNLHDYVLLFEGQRERI